MNKRQFTITRGIEQDKKHRLWKQTAAYLNT